MFSVRNSFRTIQPQIWFTPSNKDRSSPETILSSRRGVPSLPPLQAPEWLLLPQGLKE